MPENSTILLDKNVIGKLKKAKENLLQVSQKLGEAVYKAAQAKAGPGAAGPDRTDGG